MNKMLQLQPVQQQLCNVFEVGKFIYEICNVINETKANKNKIPSKSQFNIKLLYSVWIDPFEIPAEFALRTLYLKIKFFI